MPTIEELERGLQPPDGPWTGGPDLGRIRREGSSLRRRRALLVGGASAGLAACVAAVALVVPSALSGPGSDGSSAPRIAEAPHGDDELLDACRRGNGSADSTDLLFGAGRPTVESVMRNRHQIGVAIESADGKYWGSCFVNLDSQEFSSGLTVYPTAGRSRSMETAFGPGCGLVDGEVDTSCTTFWTSWVDRRPPEVAAAEVVTADGVTTTVPSRNGYLVFDYLGDLPDGMHVNSDGLPMRFSPLLRITFLDAQGKPIAAQVSDGSGRGEDHEKVADLPPLTAYPGTYGDAIY